MQKVITDTTGDTNKVSTSYDEVRVQATCGVTTTVMYFKPKQARRFAKALKKAAKAVEA